MSSQNNFVALRTSGTHCKRRAKILTAYLKFRRIGFQPVNQTYQRVSTDRLEAYPTFALASPRWLRGNHRAHFLNCKIYQSARKTS